MRLKLLSTIVALQVLLIGVQQSEGAIIASIQASPLDAGSTSQQLSFFLRSDSGAITDVDGINIHAQIGDGTDTQPGVPSFVFPDGADYGAFAASSDSSFESGGTEANNFRYTGGVLDLIPGGNAFTIGTTDTLVGTFNIDTTGVSGGTYGFFIGDSGLGAQSDVISNSGGTIDIQDFNGSFQVTAAAVPEPGTIAFLSALGIGGLAQARRRRKRACVTTE